MSRYVLEADLSDGCWNCPCEDDGWRCNAAGYRNLPIPDHDEPDLPDDYRPEWCPLVPLDDLVDEIADRVSERLSRDYGVGMRINVRAIERWLLDEYGSSTVEGMVM